MDFWFEHAQTNSNIDGWTSVKWKFMKAVVANREKGELPQLIDTGTHFVFS